MMTKNWIKVREGSYSFWVDNIQRATLEIRFASMDSKAILKIEENEFTIRRVGFWKTAIEITDGKGGIVAKVYAEKWYANSFVLEYNETKYKLVVRNNPLSEWAITDESKDVLAYGLNTSSEGGKVNVRITGNNHDYILDALLWYLFVPIATENMGDDLTFLLLV